VTRLTLSTFTRPTKAKVYWDESSWVWWAAVVLVGLDLAGLAVSRYLGGGALWPIVGNWPIVTRIFLVLAFAGYFHGRGVPPRAFGLVVFGFRKRLKEFGKCLLVILPLTAALSLMSILILRAGGARQHIAPPVAFIDSEQMVSWILVFVIALPPLEELLYRGILHPSLRQRLGVGWAIAIGGVVFGFVHWFYGIDLASLAAYAYGGAVLAYVYERTGSLLFPWTLHVATNLMAVWISRYPGFFEALKT
jgi:membrane protease YdiL (CAAX protease family)